MEHTLRIPLLLTILLAVTAGALLHSGDADAAKVYRWVDENGEVHYSETLPPDIKDRKHDVLNESGIVLEKDESLAPPPPVDKKKKAENEGEELPRDASGLPRPKPLYSEAEAQQRKDNLLMLRYDSEQEIVDAMNVEIKQLNYDRRLIEGSRDNLQSAYRDQIRQAADMQRAGQKVDAATINQIHNLKAGLAKNLTSLNGLQAREQSIREDFGKELERYRYLVEKWGKDGPEG
ncbi:MAG: DUF4124 domain-containing protein [Lysobacterales bacterium]|jgi:hypothetical protein